MITVLRDSFLLLSRRQQQGLQILRVSLLLRSRGGLFSINSVIERDEQWRASCGGGEIFVLVSPVVRCRTAHPIVTTTKLVRRTDGNLRAGPSFNGNLRAGLLFNGSNRAGPILTVKIEPGRFVNGRQIQKKIKKLKKNEQRKSKHACFIVVATQEED
jgi:hypothetical protein